MTSTVWDELIASIHASGHQVVLSVTGGGSASLSQLLASPGASRTVLEAVVPYSAAALRQWLGGVPDQACSASTARAMAMAAWLRARQLAPAADVAQLIGLGATAALATDRPRRGPHRIHMAFQTAASTSTAELTLEKGRRNREQEESLAAECILRMLGQACAVDTVDAQAALAAQLAAPEKFEFCSQPADPGCTELVLGQRTYATLPAANAKVGQVLFPGSFHPAHHGHVRMAAMAAELTQQGVTYELSVTNVEKPPLDFFEIHHRVAHLRQLDSQALVVLTTAPTFRAKAALFPGSTFVVGADTLARIADPSYYTDQVAANHFAGDVRPPQVATSFEQAIDSMAAQGCRFLVFGRHWDGRFHTLSDLTLPESLRRLCDEVSAADFRDDISSSEIRKRGHG